MHVPNSLVSFPTKRRALSVLLLSLIVVVIAAVKVVTTGSHDQDVEELSRKGRVIQQSIALTVGRSDISWEDHRELYSIFEKIALDDFATSTEYFRRMVDSRFLSSTIP